MLPQAFAAVRLQSHRLVDFVRERRQVLRRLTLTNSEGYWVSRKCEQLPGLQAALGGQLLFTRFSGRGSIRELV